MRLSDYWIGAIVDKVIQRCTVMLNVNTCVIHSTISIRSSVPKYADNHSAHKHIVRPLRLSKTWH